MYSCCLLLIFVTEAFIFFKLQFICSVVLSFAEKNIDHFGFFLRNSVIWFNLKPNSPKN
jgi:hypothetical protein